MLTAQELKHQPCQLSQVSGQKVLYTCLVLAGIEQQPDLNLWTNDCFIMFKSRDNVQRFFVTITGSAGLGANRWSDKH